MSRTLRLVIGAALIIAAPLLFFRPAAAPPRAPTPPPSPPNATLEPSSNPIVARAREEVVRGVRYDASYRTMAYPGGDVRSDRGACTDVVIRALRAVGKDLQELIHRDKVANPSLYPAYSGNRAADSNIDHRRVPNHVVYLKRFGKTLPTGIKGDEQKTWLAGDLVYVKLPSGLDHCGVVSDRRGESGLPLVIHNLGQTAEEDVLPNWKIVAHFRIR